jgi:hypothetical protein
MRAFPVFVLGLVLLAASWAAPPPAAARVPALSGDPPSWAIPLLTKVIVRMLEFVDWAQEDLRAQLDRRRLYDPPPPVIVPALDAVRSGASTTARAPARGGMIP